MKVLLDVIKTLLLINGAVVLPSFLLVMALSEQRSTNMASADNVSSKFHRNIEDNTPNYKQKLEKLEAQNNQLQAQLKASQRAQTITPVVANRPSLNKGQTKVPPVSQPKVSIISSKPSVEKPVLAKVTTVSPSQPQSTSSQRSVGRTPVSSPRKPEVAVIREEKQPSAVSEVSVAVNTSTTAPVQTDNQSSDKALATTTPKDFITPDKLNQGKAKQTQLVSYSPVAPQAKTPIQQPITLANDLSVGLIVADNRNELNYGTRNYKKVQTAILSLRKGSSQSLEEAAKRAGIDLKTLEWLAQYGQNRPGSFNPAQISMVNPE